LVLFICLLPFSAVVSPRVLAFFVPPEFYHTVPFPPTYMPSSPWPRERLFFPCRPPSTLFSPFEVPPQSDGVPNSPSALPSRLSSPLVAVIWSNIWSSRVLNIPLFEDLVPRSYSHERRIPVSSTISAFTVKDLGCPPLAHKELFLSPAPIFFLRWELRIFSL